MSTKFDCGKQLKEFSSFKIGHFVGKNYDTIKGFGFEKYKNKFGDFREGCGKSKLFSTFTSPDQI